MKIILICIFLISNICAGQDISFARSKYQIGKISFSNFKKANIKDIEIRKDSILFYNIDASKWGTTPFSDINYIRLQEGTHVGKGALLGGSISALIILSAVLDVSTDKSKVFSENAFGTTFLVIAGGTGLGALIGGATPKFKTYYFGNQKVSNLSIIPKVQIANKNFGLGLFLKI